MTPLRGAPPPSCASKRNWGMSQSSDRLGLDVGLSQKVVHGSLARYPQRRVKVGQRVENKPPFGDTWMRDLDGMKLAKGMIEAVLPLAMQKKVDVELSGAISLPRNAPQLLFEFLALLDQCHGRILRESFDDKIQKKRLLGDIERLSFVEKATASQAHVSGHLFKSLNENRLRIALI